MAIDPQKLQQEIDYITNKSKEMGIGGTDLLKIRNSIKKAKDAQDDAPLKFAYDIIRGERKAEKSTGPFQHDYIGNNGLDYESAKAQVDRRIDGLVGSVQNVIDKGAKSLMSVIKPEHTKNFQRELDSFNLFAHRIRETVKNEMTQNPKVYKIMIDYLRKMIEKARWNFNQKFRDAKATGKWKGGSAENLKILTKMGQELIRAQNPEQAKAITDKVDDFFVVIDDQPEEEPVEPAADTQVAEEDFGSKIKNIFSESFDKSYNKAIKESLENE